MKKKLQLAISENGVSFEKGYEEFLNYCKIRNLRPATIKHYNDIVKSVWYKFIDRNIIINTINKNTMNEFIVFCKEVQGQKDVTVNTNIRGMRTILYYFMKLGYIEEFKISEIKADKDIIETYTDAEINILLKKPDIKKCSFVQYRDWVIVNFLLGTGCRASTLVNIKVCDLDFDNDLIYYRHTKNRKQQIVPMTTSLKKILIEYIKYIDKQGYLFCNTYGGQLDTRSLSHTMMYYNRRLGVMKTGVHRWRHTFSKKWIMNNGDMFRLQKILGHSSIDIVKNYVNMFTTDLQRDFDTFNPLENLTVAKQSIKMR